jgi:hypothetical protein
VRLVETMSLQFSGAHAFAASLLYLLGSALFLRGTARIVTLASRLKVPVSPNVHRDARRATTWVLPSGLICVLDRSQSLVRGQLNNPSQLARQARSRAANVLGGRALGMAGVAIVASAAFLAIRLLQYANATGAVSQAVEGTAAAVEAVEAASDAALDAVLLTADVFL